MLAPNFPSWPILSQQHLIGQCGFKVTRVLSCLLGKTATTLTVFQGLHFNQVFQLPTDLACQHNGLGGAAAGWRGLPDSFKFFVEVAELANQRVVTDGFKD